MTLLKVIVNWGRLLEIAAGIVLLATLLDKVFGISVIGKKIYKGNTLFWRWIMKVATFRKEMMDRMDTQDKKLEAIQAQVEFNGGSSIKDAIKRMEAVLMEVSAQVKTNALKNDIRDLCSERMIFKVARDGSWYSVNDAFLKCFGYTEADVLGFAYENIIHDEDVLEMRTKWQRAIDKQGRFYDEERIYHRNGELFHCAVRGYPVFHSGEMIEYYGLIDIIK